MPVDPSPESRPVDPLLSAVPPPVPLLGAAPALLTTVVPGGAARSLLLRRGERLLLEALADGASASLLLYAAARPSERLCVPDTLKAQMSAVVRPPMVLMSDAGRALVSVVAATSDRHDALCGHSTDAHVARHGATSYATDRNAWRQSARRLLLDELAGHGMGERDLHATVNLFSRVDPAGDERGSLTWSGSGRGGDVVELRAEQDVLVVLATCPHPLDPAWDPAPLRLTVTAGDPPGPDDPSVLFRAESARALVEASR
ncbi:MAG: Urea carboxylase-related aminomethyltransferase [Frankiales bacterium]|nr:Urea carboxylase-related aminomethyltransferase [Frankiales bacterium]